MEANTKEEEQKQQPLDFLRSHIPWLFYSHGKRFRNQIFYNIDESRYQVITCISEFQENIGVCSFGWLLIFKIYLDEFYLWNPITKKRIQLPNNPPNFVYASCVLTLPPDDPKSVIMCFEYNFQAHILKIIFCKPGDVEWTRQDLKLCYKSTSDIWDCFEAVAVHNGDIYILTGHDKLYLVKVCVSYIELVDMEVNFLTSPKTSRYHTRCERYLVEAAGELLRVDCYFLHEDVIDFWVFKLNFEEKVWVRIKKLKDQAIFIGADILPIACSTKGSRNIQGNRIYFTLVQDRSLYEFDLDLCATEVNLPCQNVKHNWSQPYWILLPTS